MSKIYWGETGKSALVHFMFMTMLVILIISLVLTR